MAKKMVSPQSGALQKFLSTERKTFQDVSQALSVSRTTLRAINEGKPVKDETLRKVADFLRMPVDHFLCDTGAQPEISQNEDLIIQEEGRSGTRASILLKRMSGESFCALAKNQTSIQWRLSVSKLTPKAAEILRTIESSLLLEPEDASNHCVIWAPNGTLLGSQLSKLIEHIENAQTFEKHLESLAEDGISILGASYLYWRCQTEEETLSDRTNQVTHNYTSESRRIIVVIDSNISSMRESVFIGRPPPKDTSENGVIVKVNGFDLHLDIPF
jgi:transcriptional regulator with XRE-family HTH domain